MDSKQRDENNETITTEKACKNSDTEQQILESNPSQSLEYGAKSGTDLNLDSL